MSKFFHLLRNDLCESVDYMQRKHERKKTKRRRRGRSSSSNTERERERERERTKRAARKDTARSASIADKAVAHFLKFQRRRARRPTANAELQQLFRTSPAVLSM
jgi:hypothetical protein